MNAMIDFVGPNGSLQLFGVRLVGVNSQSGKKLLFTICFIVVMVLLNSALKWLMSAIFQGRKGGRGERIAFWARQAVRLLVAFVLIIGIISIWFDDPTRLATAAGLVTAGIAFALQRVITALAGYVVILRGKTFNVGDRIVMGGVRGDVVGLGFIQTTIMEMGQPPGVNEQTDPGMWVRSRQYTGRIVTVSNDKVFDTPIYNYTRDFPYIWEEMHIPVPFKSDRDRAEQILLDAAARHSVSKDRIAEHDLREIERRFAIKRDDMTPRVYWRLTDNWLELTVRFITLSHGIRDVKDAMSRDILGAFDEAGIDIASTTFELVGLPEVKVRMQNADRERVRT
jgi:small-conductance mechanosensitive channel